MTLRLILLLIISGTISSTVAVAEQYVAFSLRVAKDRILANSEWRLEQPELLYLGGINAIQGALYDERTEDVVVFGRAIDGRAPLTLDDLVVAMRARLYYRQWPLVSIDDPPEGWGKEVERLPVRWEGGIENTDFGDAMLAADYLLKQISLGIVPAGDVLVRIPWHRQVDEFERGELGPRHKSRLWFYPVPGRKRVKERVVDFVAPRLHVYTEILQLYGEDNETTVSGTQIPELRDFTSDISSAFSALAAHHVPFNRLRGLMELVMLAELVGDVGGAPLLDWWIQSFPRAIVETDSHVKMLERSHRGLQGGGVDVRGGVHLVALALRAAGGELEAIRDAILKCRPSDKVARWTCAIASGTIVPSNASQVTERFATLVTYLGFLMQHAKWRMALDVLATIANLTPGDPVFEYQRAYALFRLGHSDAALEVLAAMNNTLEQRNVLELRSIILLHEAVMEHPQYAIHMRRSGIQRLTRTGRRVNESVDWNAVNVAASAALNASEIALRNNPHSLVAWTNRGVALMLLGAEERLREWATEGMNKRCDVVEMDMVAMAATLLGNDERALACYQETLSANPKNARAWYGRGVVLNEFGRFAEAYAAFRRAALLGLQPAEEERRIMMDYTSSRHLMWANVAEVESRQSVASEAFYEGGRVLRRDPSAGHEYLIVEVTFETDLSGGRYGQLDAARMFHLEQGVGDSAAPYIWDDVERVWRRPNTYFPNLTEWDTRVQLLFHVKKRESIERYLMYRDIAIDISAPE